MARAARRGGVRRRPRVAGRGTGATARPGSRGDGLTVQLLPQLLAAGELPRAAVGDVLEVAPAIYAVRLEPGRGLDRRRDRWCHDDLGTLDAVGSVLAARVDPAGCPCRVDVLDVGGRLLPLNPAATVPVGITDDGGRVRVDGALYLDPELAAGTPYGSAVALCRRRYRVEALRRYRRTASVPVDPVPLAVVPAPAEVSEEALYVADLVDLAALAGVSDPASPGPAGPPSC